MSRNDTKVIHIGDRVIGGSMNYNGAMEVEVTHVGSDTMLSKIIHLIEDAQGRKAPISSGRGYPRDQEADPHTIGSGYSF